MTRDWWEGRTIDLDLQIEASALFTLPITSPRDMDVVASVYLHGGPISVAGPLYDSKKDPRPPRSAWEDCKREFRYLVCTEDARYKELRLALAASATGSSTIMV